ncbi:hypothetical protein CONCODRAFT_77936 [Conidiobolus coronatus NRRL 28638]|uniref:Uncharacterized protein n=1 Tax=Conidiobolus coronatus (strain ATCC 28846 / CBS 209.66 / NRRL 28638) TaxID=796925 RepID=A0A137PAW5_CONC2|nr:hypothetical protein CONCODRAFT_77936 [Conidiobolus coronatus NRRL 28638]|eukprot:KXN72135.1 hypothetical protein CONCODRAFT_77936 [Conidiobolus coronatus NRRL 28638]
MGFTWTVFRVTLIAVISTFNFGYSLGGINLVERAISECPDGLYYVGPFASCIHATGVEW